MRFNEETFNHEPPSMSQTALNLVAISVFVLTLSSLLGPLFFFTSTLASLTSQSPP